MDVCPMKIINLSKFPCLSKEKQLQQINDLIKINDTLMPHQVATATGCGIEEALALLLFLYSLSISNSKLLIYHNNHLENNPPIFAREIKEGLPELPFICDICQTEVQSPDELSYDFLFRLNEEIHFVV
jgi:hypothetical protein